LPEVTRVDQILELAASGLGNKEVAQALGIKLRTVRSHLERHSRRTGLWGRTTLVAAWLLSPGCDPVAKMRVRARLAAGAVVPNVVAA
jgi:hypothetical protein